jgi:succinoglycan biosynthesis protein ExoM
MVNPPPTSTDPAPAARTRLELALCIATCKRPQGLAQLLEAVAALEPASEPLALKIVVIDNDPAGSAREVCERFRERLGCPLRYGIEPRRGIPFARNACLLQARDADLFAFLDDDGVPERDWLRQLVSQLLERQVDVVSGPIIYRFPSHTPEFISKSSVFKVQSHATGSPRSVAYTGNALFRRTVLERVNPWFDERLANSGGSDAHFFRRVARAGFAIVWVNEAIVYEIIPASRTNVPWIMKRSFRTGNGISFYRFDQHPRWFASILTLLSFLRWTVVGTLELVPGALTGRRRPVEGLRHWAYALGIATGIGYRYRAYADEHPSRAGARR